MLRDGWSLDRRTRHVGHRLLHDSRIREWQSEHIKCPFVHWKIEDVGKSMHTAQSKSFSGPACSVRLRLGDTVAVVEETSSSLGRLIGLDF